MEFGFKHSYATHEKHRREAIPDVTRQIYHQHRSYTDANSVPPPANRAHFRDDRRSFWLASRSLSSPLTASFKDRAPRRRHRHNKWFMTMLSACLRLPHQFKSADRIFLIRALSQFFVAVASCAACSIQQRFLSIICPPQYSFFLSPFIALWGRTNQLPWEILPADLRTVVANLR